jgi:cytidylate kinase
VFVDVSDEEAARRIYAARRDTDQYASQQEVLDMTISRNKKDSVRYQALYGIDIYDMQHYDLFIDSTDKTPDEVLSMIYD